MKKFLLYAITLFTASQTLAGAADTEIKCKSASGKTTLEGFVPGDSAGFTLKVKSTGIDFDLYDRIVQAPPYNTEVNGSITVVEKFELGVYTLVARSSDSFDFVELVSVPSSVKFTSKGNKTESSFNGLLTMRSYNTQKYLGDIKVSCTTHYEI